MNWTNPANMKYPSQTWDRSTRCLCAQVHFLSIRTCTHRDYGHVLVLKFNVLRFYEYIMSTSKYFFNMIL